MCGIAGLFRKDQVVDDDIRLVKTMNDIQKHRGPDDEGLFSDNTCVLGHRRLSIIDLSDAGHQPFASDDDRYQLIYNGEIYNYIELREELEGKGHRFKTKTDTEVLLKAYQEYGEHCLSKLNGMFAFAIYDTQTQRLFLARDRFGIKPFYYVYRDQTLYFASEIKALRQLPGIKDYINSQAVFDYLVFNRTDIYNETFFYQVRRLPKGHYAVMQGDELHVEQWWNPEDYLNKHQDITIDEITKQIESILVSATQLRLRSDVKVGSCLSGGLDSSILTGILFNHNNVSQDYATFTAAFPGYDFDETHYIDALNKKFSFKNFRTTPSVDDVYKNLNTFVYAQDEPTASSSPYAQYEVMRLAKEQGVTVLLDGQGGDENFAGYHYFHGFYMFGLWRQKRVFAFLKELIKTLARRQDNEAYQTLALQMAPDFVKKKALHKRVPYLQKEFFYDHIDKSRVYNDFFNANSLNQSIVRHFQYKLEHLLRFEDRNSMAFSLEARLPYLDYRLVEFLLGVDGNLKVKQGETKRLQKKALGKYTIEDILNRKDKTGFETPQDVWMNAPQWKELTSESQKRCQQRFPNIFTKQKDLPHRAQECWKTIQLSTWQNMLESEGEIQANERADYSSVGGTKDH